MFDRTSKSLFGQWWWRVDRVTLLLLFIIAAIGTVLVMASSPSIADSRGLAPFYFVKRQSIYLLLAFVTLFFFSSMPPIYLRRIAALGFIASIVLLILVLLLGEDVKGAKRWIGIANFSMQPSEFVKPFFIVLTGWILALNNIREKFHGYLIVIGLWAVLALLLVAQPDIGMTIIVSMVCGAQLFLAGLPMVLVISGVFTGIIGVVAAYFFLPHVANRINNFIDPSSGDSYQNEKGLEAFINGGLFGRGPGEGVIKDILPDAHTDFIFAVAGEELGLIACFIIVLLYVAVIARGFLSLIKENDLFVIYAGSGLLMLFGLQVIINMGVSLNLLPNTGVTLPFMSYGGSSMISMAITMGMVLSFTCKKYGTISNKRKKYE